MIHDARIVDSQAALTRYRVTATHGLFPGWVPAPDRKPWLADPSFIARHSTCLGIQAMIVMPAGTSDFLLELGLLGQ